MRSWGSWTEVKLDALERYLPAFGRAASVKAQGRTLYLDLFAGQTMNISRASGLVIPGSAERALSAQPPLRKVVLCELNESNVATLQQLRQRHAARDVTVLSGDCNLTLPRYLEDLKRRDPGWQQAPAFAFIDQFSAELHWSTLEALARFKDLTKVRSKVELWLYFGDSFVPRGLMLRSQFNEGYAERVDAMFGGQEWRELLAARWEESLDGAGFKSEMVNLLRWKLEHDLGYAKTIQLEMVRESGHGLYSMIFATDNPTGDKIMSQVLARSESEMNNMVLGASRRRLEARLDKAKGMTGGLFGLEEVLASANEGDRDLLDLQPAHTPWHMRGISADPE